MDMCVYMDCVGVGMGMGVDVGMDVGADIDVGVGVSVCVGVDLGVDVHGWMVGWLLEICILAISIIISTRDSVHPWRLHSAVPPTVRPLATSTMT